MSGFQLTLLYFKIDNLTWLGDLNSAKEVSNDIDRLISKMRGFKSWTDWGYQWTYQAETAKGHYLMLAGKASEAELSYARALNAMDIRIKYNNIAGGILMLNIIKKNKCFHLKLTRYHWLQIHCRRKKN